MGNRFLYFILYTLLGAGNLGLGNVVHGQNVCIALSDSIGCVPFTVNVKSCVSGNFAYNYRYVSGAAITTNPIGLVTYTAQDLQGADFKYIYVAQYNTTTTETTTARIRLYADTLTPRFSLRACNQRRVAIRIKDPNFQHFVIDYGTAGLKPDTVKRNDTTIISASFPAEGDFNISVKGLFTTSQGNYAVTQCKGGTRSRTVRVVQTMQVPFINRLEVLSQDPDNGRVKLTFTADPQFDFAVQQQTPSGKFQTVQVVSVPQNGQTLVLDKLNTSTQTYCYRLMGFSACADSVPSNVICTMRITSLQAENNRVLVGWSSYQGSGNFQNYLLQSNKDTLAKPLITSYIHNDVRCGQTYSYVVESQARHPNLAVSVSAPRAIKAVNSRAPQAVMRPNANVEGMAVILNWEKPADLPIAAYTITRTSNNTPTPLVFSVKPTETAYKDDKAKTDAETYCYTIGFTDSCGNVSELTKPLCPVLLKAEQIKKDEIKLNWTAFQGWANNVFGYRIEMLDENNAVRDTRTLRAPTLAYTFTGMDTLNQVLKYRIVAFSALGEMSKSNIVTLVQEPRLALPNAFSPNSDGMNDTYRMFGRFLTQVDMRIYNRWGELVYQTDNMYEGWDGFFNGKAAPPDVYVCVVNAHDNTGRKLQQRTSVTLVR